MRLLVPSAEGRLNLRGLGFRETDQQPDVGPSTRLNFPGNREGRSSAVGCMSSPPELRPMAAVQSALECEGQSVHGAVDAHVIVGKASGGVVRGHRWARAQAILYVRMEALTSPVTVPIPDALISMRSLSQA